MIENYELEKRPRQKSIKEHLLIIRVVFILPEEHYPDFYILNNLSWITFLY